MNEFIHHPIVKGAIAGLVSAALIDLQAFRAFKSVTDFKAYAWDVALFRWGQGLVVGAVTALGLSF